MIALEGERDWEGVYDLVTEDCVTSMGELVLHGKAEMRAYDAKYFIPVFSRSARTIFDIAADGDAVVFRWRADATLAADGRAVSWEGVSWCPDGRREVRRRTDLHGLGGDSARKCGRQRPTPLTNSSPKAVVERFWGALPSGPGKPSSRPRTSAPRTASITRRHSSALRPTTSAASLKSNGSGWLPPPSATGA
ncbi:MAG: nuclear transport factor 2 family protein [Dehalococcoidia bacterium]|nr:nuclear transport factor 2 family protein [Dehalococcoidia bacterium]